MFSATAILLLGEAVMPLRMGKFYSAKHNST